MPTTDGTLTRAEPLRSSSWDAEAGTFLLVLSAGAPVARYDARGEHDEVLDLRGAKFPERIPLLDSHRRESLDDVIGHVADIHLSADGHLVGKATLSRHSPRAQRIAAELTDGNTFGASIGYRAGKWSERTDPSTKRRVKTATAFDLLEASLVSVPADASAGIRSTPVTDNTTTTRADVNAEIRSIAKVAGLDQAWIDTQIDADATAEQARTAAFEAMAARSTTTAGIRSTSHNDTSLDNPEVRVRAAGEALYSRINPAHTPSDQARQLVGLTTLDLARDSLRHAGVATTGLSPASVIERALHGTGDFPMIISDTVNRTLRDSYAAAPSGIRRLARQSTVRDFKPKSFVQLSNAPTLELVNEHGEFKAGTLAEAKESYKIDTFGRMIGVTRQMLINDDLQAFSDLARRVGSAAAAFEASFLVNMVTSNPKMGDGKAVFHADHKNLAGTAAAISEASISAARLAMRKQTEIAGDLISVTPKFLVVGPELETTAEKFLATIAAAKTDDVNPFSGSLTLVVEPRLTGKEWYIAADAGEVPGIEFSYLEGEAGPQTATEAGFDVDGVRIRVRLDFGAGWIDHRGWYKNAGA